jgi:hypothetical protein
LLRLTRKIDMYISKNDPRPDSPGELSMVASVALMILVVLVSGEAPDSSAHTSTIPPSTPSETLKTAGIEMLTGRKSGEE